jgi:steroid 5-alpha reductase family enzyme
MSASHEKGSWVDRWWPLLLILFGVTFVTILVSFKPGI